MRRPGRRSPPCAAWPTGPTGSPRSAPAPSSSPPPALLDGRRATTHWSACERLAARHPDVEVEPDRIYVRDGDVWTSAGVTAGIDLALALVEHDHGPELAHAVAGWLVVFVRRPGGQAQFSAQLLAQPARSPAIVELQRWIPDHLDGDLTVEALAARVGMSPRNLARRFKEEAGRDAGGLRRGAAGRGRPPPARVDRPHRRRRRPPGRRRPRRDAAPVVPAPPRHHPPAVPRALPPRP